MSKSTTSWVNQASQKATRVLSSQPDSVKASSFSYSKSVSPAQLQTKLVYKS